jgi:citrate lyase subunit beta/citryl-CoA lyase
VSAVDSARSLLFVPGNRSDRFAKAAASGADVVIVDLEDAVDPIARPDARLEVARALDGGAQIAVRINAHGTDDFALDLEALAGARENLVAVVLAKAETAASVLDVSRVIGRPVVALIESAVGLLSARELSEQPGVVRLAFGAVDYSLDIDATPDDDVLAYPRSVLVAASRAAGIAAPIDTPSIEFRDIDVVAAAATTARRFGMGGKLCIHPAQVPAVAAAFTPTAAEVARARRIVDGAMGDGAGAVDGEMIDKPVIERARRLIASAEARS